MSEPTQYSSTNEPSGKGLFIVIVIVLAILGALIVAIQFGAWDDKVTNPKATSTTQPFPNDLPMLPLPDKSASKTSECGTEPTFNAKVKNAHVDGGQGPEFAIQACLTGSYVVYGFDYDPDDSNYYMVTVDDSNTNGPIITQSGAQSFKEPHIGDPGDKDRLTVVTFVFANSECQSVLQRLNTDKDNTLVLSNKKFKALPGCKVAQQVNVYVTN